MSETLTHGVTVPSHSSVEALNKVLATKGEPTAKGMYPSDGTAEVIEIETRTAGLLNLSQSEIVALQSGMVALEHCVDLGLLLGRKPGKAFEQQTIAAPQQLYTQSSVLFEEYAKRGVRVEPFDSGDPADVADILQNVKPDVFVFETLSNGTDMPVADTQHILEVTRNLDIDDRPTLVADDTLTAYQGSGLVERISPEDPLFVVGSGFKAITKNVEPYGLAYSKNPALLERLRLHRITHRGAPTPASSRAILETLLSVDTEDDLEEARTLYTERNERINRNNFVIANVMQAAVEAGAPFTVHHPNIGNHPNRELVEKTCKDGIAPAPVFYLKALRNGLNQQQLLSGLYDASPDVQEHASLQQSFAFDHTALLHSMTVPAVRIAVGANTDTDALGLALYDAAINLKNYL